MGLIDAPKWFSLELSLKQNKRSTQTVNLIQPSSFQLNELLRRFSCRLASLVKGIKYNLSLFSFLQHFSKLLIFHIYFESIKLLQQPVISKSFEQFSPLFPGWVRCEWGNMHIIIVFGFRSVCYIAILNSYLDEPA